MTVNWLRFETFVEYADGRTLAWSGERLEVNKGDRIGSRVVLATRFFELGTRVIFEPAEFAEMCLTIVIAAKDLATSIESYGRSRGITFRTLQTPTRTLETVTPNPSLQRTIPGRSPGHCR